MPDNFSLQLLHENAVKLMKEVGDSDQLEADFSFTTMSEDVIFPKQE
jgi:hypothetical protein